MIHQIFNHDGIVMTGQIIVTLLAMGVIVLVLLTLWHWLSLYAKWLFRSKS